MSSRASLDLKHYQTKTTKLAIFCIGFRVLSNILREPKALFEHSGRMSFRLAGRGDGK